MCGRYALGLDDPDISEYFSIDEIDEGIRRLRLPTWNAAPSQQLPVVAQNKDGKRELRPMDWGLKPVWWKPGKAPAPINARSETAASGGMFKGAFANRRCIVPASGYYEWKGPKGHKQPYYIHLASGDPIGFAGLYEARRTEDGDDWELTFTIMTTEPAPEIAHIHDRMPVILHREDMERWLDRETTEPGAVQPLLHPYDGELDAYPVSTRVGAVANNDPELIEPIDADHD